MNHASARRTLLGILGLLASACLLAQVPLYFIYDGAPPDWVERPLAAAQHLMKGEPSPGDANG
jgi:hypothetical protein